jgi:hypothetical protein
VTRISAAHAAACMVAGDGEEWIRSMELDPMDEPVDAAAWMAAEVCACVSALARVWSWIR